MRKITCGILVLITLSFTKKIQYVLPFNRLENGSFESPLNVTMDGMFSSSTNSESQTPDFMATTWFDDLETSSVSFAPRNNLESLQVSPPENVSLTGINQSAVYITWTLPVNEIINRFNVSIQYIGPIDEYGCQRDPYLIFQEVNDTMDYMFTNGVPYSEYKVMVASITDAGQSSFSLSQTAYTMPDIPDPPREVLVDQISNISFHVKWEKPDCSNGRLLGYIIDVETLSSQDSDNCYVTQNSSSVEFSADMNDYVIDATPYSRYHLSVSAINFAGESQKYIYQETVETLEGVPNPPGVVSVNNISNTSFHIKWTKPDCSNGPLLGYVIYVDALEPLESNKCNVSQNSEVKVAASIYNYTFYATPYTGYNVSVAAFNIAGESQKYVYEKTVVTSEGVPDPPREVLVDQISNISFHVKWEKPDCSNGRLLRYIIYVDTLRSQDSDNCYVTQNSSVEVSADMNDYAIDATPYSRYHLSVSAINVAGESQKCIYQETVETLEGVPNPPEVVSVNNISNTSFHIKWTKPDCSNGPLLGYVIYVDALEPLESNKCNVSQNSEVKVAASINNYTFDAAPYTRYNVSVAAFNIAGESQKYVYEKTVITSEGVPRKLSYLSVSRISNYFFSISWKMPDCKNGVMLGFKIYVELFEQLSKDNCPTDNVYLRKIVGFNETQSIISAKPYSVYKVFVTGFTIAGESSKAMLFVQTDQGVPSAPINLKYETLSMSFTVMWERPDCMNGQFIHYNLSVQWLGYQLPCNCCIEESTQFFSTKDSFYNFKLAHPFSKYNVTVAAVTIGGQGESESVIFSTLQHNLKPVTIKACTPISATTAYIDVALGCPPYGVATSLLVDLLGSRTGYDDHNLSIPLNLSNFQNDVRIDLISLQAEFNYSVTIAAESTEPGELAYCYLMQPAGIPEAPQSLLQAEPFGAEDPTRQALIVIDSTIFNQSMGDIQYYSIIIGEKGYLKEPEGNVLSSSICSDWMNFSNWNYANDGDHVQEYQTSPLCWNPFNGTNETHSPFIIGAQIDCNNEYYCNGPLRPNVDYEMKIRGFTSAGYRDTRIISFHTDSEVNVTLVVLLTVGILTLGCIALVALLFKTGRSFCNPREILQRDAFEAKPKAIPVKKFVEYSSELLENPAKLSNEYHFLGTLSQDIITAQSFSAGIRPDNKRKNRYVNIIPYDSTRVVLDVIEGDTSSDYINASFIKGYKGEIEYIASQGPKEDTVIDFWRMVYQHSVRVIVMLTNLEEDGKPKCHQYYPNLRDSMEVGDMIIHCTTELHFPIYTSRSFILHKDNEKRMIIHLHFREWPDFGCPMTTDVMLNFCQTVRKQVLMSRPGLTLVHCSAGVGRTGTLIAVDILLQHIRENKTVDIFDVVFELRKQRQIMVQAESQYVYIYRCIRDALKIQQSINAGKQTTKTKEPIYRNISENNIAKYTVKKVRHKPNILESECEL